MRSWYFALGCVTLLLVCGSVSGQIVFPDGSAQSTAADPATSGHTVSIRPTIGDPAASGQTLRFAVAVITLFADASADFPYLVDIEPGTYDVGSTPFIIPANVSLRGAGIDVTIIRGNPGTGFVVQTSGNNVIRDLTIRHLGGSGLAEGRALQANGLDVILDQVRCVVTGLFANGATLTGISTAGGCHLVATDCVVDIENVTNSGSIAVGIAVSNAPSDLTADGLRISVNPNLSASFNVGINVDGSDAVNINAMRLFTQSSSTSARGISANSGSLVNVRSSRIAANGGFAVTTTGTPIRMLACEVVGARSGSDIIIRQSMDGFFNDLSMP